MKRITSHMIRNAIAIILIMSMIALSGCSFKFSLPGASTSSTAESAPSEHINASSSEDTANAIEELKSVRIAETDDSAYNQDIRKKEYGTWKDYKGWSTRDELLAQNAKESTQNATSLTSGTWYCEYTGEDLTYNSKEDIANNIQIDHIIPVAYAHKHGASGWSEDKKKEYYNDMGTPSAYTTGATDENNYEKVGTLIISDAKSNTAKGDKGPSRWMPNNKNFWTTYLKKWVHIAHKYDIALSREDYDFIADHLQHAA